MIHYAADAGIEPFKQRRKLRRRQALHSVLDLRPAELAVLQPFGDEAAARAVPKNQFDASVFFARKP
jgi:hypothetical protein